MDRLFIRTFFALYDWNVLMLSVLICEHSSRDMYWRAHKHLSAKHRVWVIV